MIGKMGRALVALTLAAGGLAASFNIAAAQNPSDVARQAPACTASNGKRVEYHAVRASTIAAEGFSLAMAGFRDGKAVVWYDAAALARAPAEFSAFILYHECAHHQMGHTITGGGRNRELAADCQAMKTLMRRGYGKEELAVITGHFNRYYSSAEVNTYYPPMDQRMEALERCFTRNL